MLIVGLTGTSGAGKGYICYYLEKHENFLIIDTDALYHRMISAPSPTTDALVAEFGQEILDTKGGIDRNKLRAIVFSDKIRLEKLNKTVHSLILKECRSIMSSSDKSIAVIDAPQLFESGFDKECHVTIAVVADTELRIKRIMMRDRISREDALRRINNQHSDDWFRDNCDIVIENNGPDPRAQVNAVIKELERLYGEKEKKKTQA